MVGRHRRIDGIAGKLMSATVGIARTTDGLAVIEPNRAHPSLVGDEPALDTAVLEVIGGHLAWSLLDADAPPVAVLDDVASAQVWVWAVYGEAVAVALDDSTGARDVDATPALPELAASARQLAYALWAQRWWPASTIDAIPPLDEQLLAKEIAALVEQCDLLVDADFVPSDAREDALATALADDYALAAGAATATAPGALVLARGSGGADWRRSPAGIVDASESAVAWQLLRTSGTTSIQISVVAAPGLGPLVPPHLHPRAVITAQTNETIAVPLQLAGDSWVGTAAVAFSPETPLTVDIEVPGFGAVGTDSLGGPQARQRVRQLVRQRMREAGTGDGYLLAEIAAAASDSDF